MTFCFREHKAKLYKFPRSGDDVRGLHEVIKHYIENDFWLVAVAYVSIYVK